MRVTAYNEKGWSQTASLTSTVAATAKTIPAQMTAATIQRGSKTSETQIHVTWSAVVLAAKTGDSAILSYNLQYDQGTSLWVNVVGDPTPFTQTETIITTGITKGTNYKFKIKARNVYDWAASFTSPNVIIAASDKPA